MTTFLKASLETSLGFCNQKLEYRKVAPNEWILGGRSSILTSVHKEVNFNNAFACSRPKFLKTFRSRTHRRGEEPQLCSGWISIRLELPSLNFSSSARAEQSFAIRLPNAVIKSLCGNLDICLNFYLRSRISVTDCDRKWKMLFKLRFSAALLNSLFTFHDWNGQRNRARKCNYCDLKWVYDEDNRSTRFVIDELVAACDDSDVTTQYSAIFFLYIIFLNC